MYPASLILRVCLSLFFVYTLSSSLWSRLWFLLLGWTRELKASAKWKKEVVKKLRKTRLRNDSQIKGFHLHPEALTFSVQNEENKLLQWLQSRGRRWGGGFVLSHAREGFLIFYYCNRHDWDAICFCLISIHSQSLVWTALSLLFFCFCVSCRDIFFQHTTSSLTHVLL